MEKAIEWMKKIKGIVVFFMLHFACVIATPPPIPWSAIVANRSDGTVNLINLSNNTASAPIMVQASGSFTGPVFAAITPDGETAYVTGHVSPFVYPITISTGTVGTAIGVGNGPFGIAIAPNGTKVLVCIDNTISQIDLPSGNISTTMPPLSSIIDLIAITPNGKTALVTHESANVVTPFDLTTSPPTAGPDISITTTSFGIAVVPNGKTAFVCEAIGTHVTPIDLTVSPPSALAPITVSNGTICIAITPDGNTAYVTGFSGFVTAIDVNSKTVGPSVSLGSGVGPVDIAITPDGKKAYVTLFNATPGQVIPIDLTTNTPTPGTPITVGLNPEGIAITPDQAPIAAFTVIERPAGLPTAFDASLSYSPTGPTANPNDNKITNYSWNFGDGSPIVNTSSSTISHTYAISGTYTVILTVTNATGTSTTRVFTGQTISRNGGPNAQLSQSITIKRQPTETTLTVFPNPSCVGKKVTLTAFVTSPIGAPSGMVAFYSKKKVIGTGILNASGQAILEISTLSARKHCIAARYKGNGTFASSISNVVPLVVKPIKSPREDRRCKTSKLPCKRVNAIP